jgi:hypothetical protein
MKKFIVVNDTATATKFIAAGFKLVSQIGSNYTFINELPKNFTFDSVGDTKYHFTNILGM